MDRLRFITEDDVQVILVTDETNQDQANQNESEANVEIESNVETEPKVVEHEDQR